MDVLGPQAGIESGVTVILEDSVIFRFHDAGVVGRIGQLEVVRLQFSPDLQAPVFLNFLIGQLLPARLDGEISLPERHQLLRRIGILDDEVAGVA